jgi:hypothetical protein
MLCTVCDTQKPSRLSDLYKMPASGVWHERQRRDSLRSVRSARRAF